MVVGFTGSRHGMNVKKEERLRSLLISLEATELHHGDCVGADAQAFEVAKSLGIKTVAHPPTNEKLRAFTESDEVRKAKPYLVRNRDIVDECDVLLGAPKKGSKGTVYTMLYARSKSVRVYGLSEVEA